MHQLLESILGNCHYRFSLYLKSSVSIAFGPWWRQGIGLCEL